MIAVAVSGCAQDNNPLNSSNISSYLSNSTQPTNSLNTGKGEVSGKCTYVVDGDTIDVEGVGRIRFVGVNTPERGQPGYSEAKEYVKSRCLDKSVSLDIDDKRNKDKYGRTLAVVYVGDVNLNQELLKKGLAEVMYIPPSEFNPYSWT